MATATVVYEGELRTRAEHLKSGEKIQNDAPTDNHGKGEAFSPTDMLATSLVTCMITVMGIKAREEKWDMGEVRGELTKVMASGPRRVNGIHCEIYLKGSQLGSMEQKALESVALNCPVAKSLHPDIRQVVFFHYE